MFRSFRLSVINDLLNPVCLPSLMQSLTRRAVFDAAVLVDVRHGSVLPVAFLLQFPLPGRRHHLAACATPVNDKQTSFSVIQLL